MGKPGFPIPLREGEALPRRVRKPAFPTLLPVTGRPRPDICWQAVGKPEFLALLGDKK